ncbi:MAG: DeoR/GlpR family DNA-binding transcription regulator, partial [Acetatifactor sp.]|nr:DeoR/GlpR family DNA-binding transcription regulator [Acetatifactor sp.]
MLTKQRYDLILKLLEEQKSVTLTELKELLHTSESTVRRDIVALDKAGKLTKVFGGAVVLEQPVITYEPTVEQKRDVKVTEKQRIAAYAASLVGQEEFIYLDAGTTTGCLIVHLEGRGVSVVTNAVAHAR